ncbi:hypothetical protein EVA_10574 [gut metagenome]|uniref:Uncharacterized protein n=1 Tax=gut metagenome TaxID=749906 RepID=J9G272_9ZZZZ
MPLSRMNTGRHSRLMRCDQLTTVTPTSVEIVVVSRVGMNISVGCAAPICARYTMMLTGIRMSPDVFITRNMIIGLVAVSFCEFSSCSSFIAFSPIGVAALSSPNMLADRFIKMLPMAGCPFGISGNSRQNNGLSQRLNVWIIPLCSPIFKMPSHSANMPVSPNEISKAFFDESKVALTSSVKIAVSPQKSRRKIATRNAMTKNATQI